MAEPVKLHIGHLIKKVFDESGLTVSELARRVHLERTTIYSIFERPSVDVILLTNISKALNHNFLSDIELLSGLQPCSQTFTININSSDSELSSRIASQLAKIARTKP